MFNPEKNTMIKAQKKVENEYFNQSLCNLRFVSSCTPYSFLRE